MIRTAIIALILIILPACRSRPFETLMRGSMLMSGDMNMRGDMRMEGDMNMTGEMSTVMRTDNTASRLVSVPVYAPAANSAARKVVVVDLDGLLVNKNISGMGSMGENPVALFREKLDAVATDPNVAAIVLRINSPGGGVTATDMMHRDLLQLKAQLRVPIVACLMDVGAGGGYYIATAADRIVAHPTSIVGGIGVILNVYFLEDALANFGVIPIPIKAGDRVNAASPERMMEEGEREMLQDIANQFHQRFIDCVKSSRRQVQDDSLFDGRVMTGQQAQQLGLVDVTGYLDDAIVSARQLANLPADAPIAMLRRDNDRAYTLLDITPNQPTMSSLVPLKIPGLDRSSMPTFLYMWQPEPSMASGS